MEDVDPSPDPLPVDPDLSKVVFQEDPSLPLEPDDWPDGEEQAPESHV